MSRDWNEHKYTSTQDLWCWIDEQAHEIDSSFEWVKGHGGESYKLLLMGRKEMLDKIADYLHENETTLGEIAKRWGLGVKDDQ